MITGLRREAPVVLGVRDVIIPRPGRVFCSVDYTGGELVTFAESCVERIGFSRMGEILVSGKDVHCALAADMMGVDYDDFFHHLKKLKSKRHKDFRQGAKPANFGFPGGMAEVKLALQQRKAGPDTPHPAGPSEVWDDGAKTFVPGYKGLRFCTLIGGAERCGERKVTEWRRRPTPPICVRCVECAADLRAAWFRKWPEARPYLDWHSRNVDGVGEVVQLYSGRVRGGADFCAEANGDFQALLADIAKRALCRISREMYDRTRGSVLYGSRMVVFAHDEVFSEVPEDVAHECATRKVDIMVEEFRKGCPRHAAACKAEPALARRWYKQMEAVYKDGRLVPWEPVLA